jgi:opacity protein-like surface antigen
MYNQNSGHGNKLTVWGLTAEQRWAMGAKNVDRKTTPYVGAGIGVYRVRGEAGYVPPDDIATVAGSGAGTTEGESDSETKTRIGGRVMAGLTFSESYYAELAYNLTGKVLDSRSDSITLSIGARL